MSLSDFGRNVQSFFGFGGGPEFEANRGNFNVPGFTSQFNNYSRLSNHFGTRGAPQMGESSFRQNQGRLAGMLEQQAMGRGPGQALVRAQAQTAANNAQRQQLGIAAAAAPGSSATAARGAALASGDIQAQVGQQAAQGGLAAQLGAVGQLGGVLQGARGQDLARGQANMQSRLQQTGMNDQAQMEALRQRLQASGMQQGGGMNYEQMRNQFSMNAANQPNPFGNILGMGAGLGQAYMMSQAGGGGQQRSQIGASGPSPYNYGFSIPGRGY